MPSTCVKIKLKAGSATRVEEWSTELTRRADEVLATLHAEGVHLEAAFLDHQADGDYLIYYMHAADFEHVSKTARASTAPIDAYHRQFKADCWEASTKLKPLIDFLNPRQ